MQELGANLSLLLVHHVDGLTYHDLTKFDQAAKDVILKRESLKLWETLNSLGTRMQDAELWMEHNAAEDTKNELREEFDEKLETELEALSTKMGKQMTAFFQSKVTVIDQKMSVQEDKIVK